MYLNFHCCAAFMLGSKYTFPSIRIINNGFRNQIQIFCGSIQKIRDASVNGFPPNLILQCTHKGAVLMNQSQKEPVSGHSPTLSSGTTLTLRDQL